MKVILLTVTFKIYIKKPGRLQYNTDIYQAFYNLNLP